MLKMETTAFGMIVRKLGRSLLHHDEAGLADLARTAVRVSYAPAAVKARILEEIDAT